MGTDCAEKRFSGNERYLDVSCWNLDNFIVCSSCRPLKPPCLFIQFENCKCLHTFIAARVSEEKSLRSFWAKQCSSVSHNGENDLENLSWVGWWAGSCRRLSALVWFWPLYGAYVLHMGFFFPPFVHILGTVASKSWRGAAGWRGWTSMGLDRSLPQGMDHGFPTQPCPSCVVQGWDQHPSPPWSHPHSSSCFLERAQHVANPSCLQEEIFWQTAACVPGLQQQDSSE